MLQTTRMALETRLRNTGNKTNLFKNIRPHVIFEMKQRKRDSSAAYMTWRHSKDEGRSAGG